MATPSLLAPATRRGAQKPTRRSAQRPAPSPRIAPLADIGELPSWDRHQPPWPGREVTSGGVTLHVRDTPGPSDATPAVYVHGLSGSGTNWTDLAAQLAPHAPGLAVDLPGFGHSRPLASRDYSPGAHADALLCFLAGQGRPVHLLGNSMGGAIGLVVAARRPELVKSLTLLAPAMPDRRPDPRRVSDPRFFLVAVPGLRRRVIRAMTETTPRERVEQMIRLCYGDPASVAEHRIAEAIEEGAVRNSQPWANDALLRTTKGMIGGWFAGPSLWTAAARVTAPTLVVWGGRDRLVAPRLAARTTTTLPRGRLLALPEVGHVPQMEVPVTVARAVLGMWRAVDAGEW
ncbi:MAG TPA: alpha/beta fold hydrolase [Pseudonocardia sp.]|nr:alpha/beta fold hydrolase [Pseudonocardia sp.]